MHSEEFLDFNNPSKAKGKMTNFEFLKGQVRSLKRVREFLLEEHAEAEIGQSVATRHVIDLDAEIEEIEARITPQTEEASNDG